jgi:hypothetical protein
LVRLSVIINDTFGNEYKETRSYNYRKEYMPAGNGEKYFESV